MKNKDFAKGLTIGIVVGSVIAGIVCAVISYLKKRKTEREELQYNGYDEDLEALLNDDSTVEDLTDELEQLLDQLI